MSVERSPVWMTTLNLVVPGGGLILAGHVWTGAGVALLFTAAANLAVTASMLVPDEFSPWWGGICIGIAGGTYVGAQIRMARAVRDGVAEQSRARRRECLLRASEALGRGDVRAARAALAPLEPEVRHDLLIAYRVAQVLTAERDVSRALAAWRQVRQMDRHRIYRDEVERNEQFLRSLHGGAAEG